MEPFIAILLLIGSAKNGMKRTFLLAFSGYVTATQVSEHEILSLFVYLFLTHIRTQAPAIA
jgi:hypothetical protein